MRSWVQELASVRWQDDQLVLRTRSMEAAEVTIGEGEAIIDWSNWRFHRCVMRIVRRALPRLDGVVPVDRLKIELEGKIEPWDAT